VKREDVKRDPAGGITFHVFTFQAQVAVNHM